jgi:hypothetical protein
MRRGISLKTFLPIPLPIIPPALSSIKEMMLTDCTAERAAIVKFCLADPGKN